jgi:hypothetical protein
METILFCWLFAINFYPNQNGLSGFSGSTQNSNFFSDLLCFHSSIVIRHSSILEAPINLVAPGRIKKLVGQDEEKFQVGQDLVLDPVGNKVLAEEQFLPEFHLCRGQGELLDPG